VLRGGRSEPAEETPSNKCRGHGWVNVFSFGHGVVLGLTTHVLDHGEGRADVARSGSSSFPEAVRCPLKAGGRGRVDRAKGEGEPSGNCGRGSPIGGGFNM
jgi:hypothetical protein